MTKFETNLPIVIEELQAKDVELQNQIDNEIAKRTSADVQLQVNVDAEASTRSSAVQSLQAQIDALETSIVSAVPSGVILAWSGTVATIPDGFHLCDGTNGTPNLLDRFIVGAGSSYSVGATGGENYHTLTITEMPSHKHNVLSAGGSVNWQPQRGFRTGDTQDGYIDKSANGLDWISYTGGNQPHENRPPYYSLAYIMKL